MITQVFAVRDRQAQAYGNPFFMHTKGLAIRSFTQEVTRKDASNMLNLHPEDFDLYCLGSYDDSDGMLHPLTPPECVIQGTQAIAAAS